MSELESMVSDVFQLTKSISDNPLRSLLDGTTTFSPQIADTNANQRLQKAVQNHRWTAFEFTILEECNETDLNFRELFWMQQYGSFLPLLGFNSMMEYHRLQAWAKKRSS